MSRLSIEISAEEHQKIKALAAMQGLSIKDFILKKTIETRTEKEDEAWAEFEKLLESRIREAEDGEVLHLSFDEIITAAKAGH